MKTIQFLIAAAATLATLTSCKEKELPWVNLEESNYCAEAKALLPSAALTDSLSYLAGIQFGAEGTYSFKGLNMDRFNKAVADFKAVDFKTFNEAAQTNFAEGYADIDRFEIDPALLGEILNKVAGTEEENVTPGQRDSASYIYGVLCSFRIASMGMDADRVCKSMENFMKVDIDRKFQEYAMGNFTDTTYVEYAKGFEIDPKLFNGVVQQYQQAKQQAQMKNYELQSKTFVEKAVKVKGFNTKAVSYLAGPDSTATSKIIYRFNTKGNGAQVALGDDFKVKYKGMHIDQSSFDEGEFPVTGFSEGNLVTGFTEALLLMHEGDKLTVVIPSELGYGERGSYQFWTGTYTIFPHETLVFDIAVSEVVKPEAEKAVEEAEPAEEPAEAEAEEAEETPAESAE